jgi:two-component system sensor histidine kinase DegS
MAARRYAAGVNVTDSPSSTLNPSTFLQLQEEERQRLAHALMNGPGQVLANTLMEIEYALPLLEKNPPVAVAGLTALRDELRNGLAQLKDFVAELQPPLLDEMGLGASIRQYVKKFGERTDLRVECRGCEDFHERYPRTIELALFRILQECLTNVAVHAKATSVRVELTHGVNHIRLTVQDNGRGFVTRSQNTSKKRPLGLIAMRDRVELLGGQMQLFSETGHGVRVVVTIPYHGHAAESNIQGGQATHDRSNHKHAQTTRQGNTHSKIKSSTDRRIKSAAATRAGSQKRVRR